MGRVFDGTAHVGIGSTCGYFIFDPRYRHWAYLAAATFLSYESLQAWRKGDEGYVELKEFGIGLGLGAAAKLLVEELLERLEGSEGDRRVYGSRGPGRIDDRVGAGVEA